MAKLKYMNVLPKVQIKGTETKDNNTKKQNIRVVVKRVESGGRTAEAKTFTANGTYNCPDGKYYDPITVNVSGGSGVSKLYCWRFEYMGEFLYWTITDSPKVGDKCINDLSSSTEPKTIDSVNTDDDGNVISIRPSGDSLYSRYSNYDVEL